MNGTSPRIRVTVTCGTCHERLITVAKPYERKMKCPECDATIRVAAYDPIEAEFQRRLSEPRNIDPGVYSIAGQSDAEDQLEVPAPETISLKCPCCQSLLHPEVRDEAWFDTCPDCLEQYRVPPRSEIPEKPKPIVIPDPGQYRTGAASKPVPLNTRLFEQISAIKEVELDPPPKWTFFSQVFQYPWSSYVWPKWVWMSIGWSISWALVTGVTFLILMGGLAPIGAAFLALPAFWFSFMTLSYSASCVMTVLEGTAAGQQTIDEWPDPDWKDWGAKLLYLAFVGLIAQALSGCITVLTLFTGLEWYVGVGTMHVLYPIVLLSALETANPFWPISKPVLHSMISHAQYWILYFLVSISLTAVYLAVVLGSVFSLPFLGALWIGPLTAAFLLLQVRLLGRLGWRVVVEPDGGKKRLKKMAKIKRWNEEPLGKFDPVPPESTSL